jgi:hypothetical protein
MTVKFQPGGPPEGATLAIHIEMTAQVNVTAFVAQQKVTRFVITQISTQLLGDTPELSVGQRLSWSVPIMLTSPARGILGKVGEIAVDATTGELLVDDVMVRRINDDARRLAESSPL